MGDEADFDERSEELLRRTGRFPEAIDLLRQYVAQEDNAAALELLLVDTLIAGGMLAEAEEALSQPRWLDNSSWAWFDARMRLDTAHGDCDAALARLEGLSGITPAQLDQARVELFESCGKITQALEKQTQIVQAHPQDPAAQLRLSTLLERAQQTGQAVEVPEKMLAEAPNDPLLLNNLGYLLTQAGAQPDRAAQLLQKSFALQPSSPPLLDSLGWYHYKKGEFQRALALLYQAVGSMPRDEYEVLDHLGDALYRLQQPELAGRFWQRALADLEKRRTTRRDLERHFHRLLAKLQDLREGKNVSVARLFSEIAPQTPLDRQQLTGQLQENAPDESDNQ